MWILLFCAGLAIPPEQDSKPNGPDIQAADCEVLGLFDTSLEAVEFGRDYCMDEFQCMANMRLNPVVEDYNR